MKLVFVLASFILSTVLSFADIYPLSEVQQKKILNLLFPIAAMKMSTDSYGQVQAYYDAQDLNSLSRTVAPVSGNLNPDDQKFIVGFGKNGFSVPTNIQIRHAISLPDGNSGDNKNTFFLLIEFNQPSPSDDTPGLIGIATVQRTGDQWKVASKLTYVGGIGAKGQVFPSEVKKIAPNNFGFLFEGTWQGKNQTLGNLHLFLLEGKKLREIFYLETTTGNIGACRASLATEPFEDRRPATDTPPSQDKSLPECYSYDLELSVIENKIHDGLYVVEVEETGTKLSGHGIIEKATGKKMYEYSKEDKRYNEVKK